jgi:hypothetical protein
MALFVMLPVFFFFNYQDDHQFPTMYMDCVAIAILVNESKYRPLYSLLAEFFFFEHDL